MINQGKRLLRHATYCRKAVLRNRNRRKACTICINTKTKCDLARPACSRCRGRGLPCSYDDVSDAGLEDTPYDRLNVQKSRREIESSDGARERISNSKSGIGRDQNTDWKSTQASPNRSRTPDQELDNDNDLAQSSIYTQSRKPSPITSKTSGISTKLLNFASGISPIIRPRQFRNRSLLYVFVSRELLSYPNLLLNQGLPPFIHSADKVRPLRNCELILQWHSCRDSENLIYIWNTIHAEQERLLEEVSNYSSQPSSPGLRGH